MAHRSGAVCISSCHVHFRCTEPDEFILPVWRLHLLVLLCAVYSMPDAAQRVPQLFDRLHEHNCDVQRRTNQQRRGSRRGQRRFRCSGSCSACRVNGHLNTMAAVKQEKEDVSSAEDKDWMPLCDQLDGCQQPLNTHNNRVRPTASMSILVIFMPGATSWWTVALQQALSPPPWGPAARASQPAQQAPD